MSANFKSVKSVKSVAATNYCKVCHDSGKPESEYRSHSTRETRDPNSRITCPVLLALECRFCHKTGHTVKYCPALKDKKRDEARASKKLSSNTKPKAITEEKVANFYDCLLEEECEECEEECEIFIKTNNSHLNYAAALAKPVVKEFAPIPIPAPVSVVRTSSVMPMEKKSWVQMSMESDTEDEEDGSAW
jgi:ribosomal protein L44E